MNKENLERIFNDDFGTSLFPILADMYFNDGEYDEAKKVCEVGMLLNPDNNDGKFVLAKIALIEGYNKEAITLLKGVIASDCLYPNALKTLAYYYYTSNKNHRAMLKIAHQLLELIPKDELALEIIESTKIPPKSQKTNLLQPKTLPIRRKRKKNTQKNTNTTKTKKQNININPKMATLTFVDILIKQEQYDQAQNVLDLVKKNKTISKLSIEQRQKKINKGLSKD